MNKFGKKILQSLEDEERTAGRNPNWVSLLPRVTVAVNSFQDKDSKSSSAYEAVFGLKYHDFPGSLKDLRGINTIEEYLKVFPDSNMQRLANLFCLDGDVEDDVNGEKDGTGNEVKQILEDGTTNDPSLKKTQSLRTLTSPYWIG